MDVKLIQINSNISSRSTYYIYFGNTQDYGNAVQLISGLELFSSNKTPRIFVVSIQVYILKYINKAALSVPTEEYVLWNL